MMQVIKRDGRFVPFNVFKIENAIMGAVREVYPNSSPDETAHYTALAQKIANHVRDIVEQKEDQVAGIEDIQDIVEERLMREDQYALAKAYILYRQKRSEFRQKHNRINKVIEESVYGSSENSDAKRENANINGNSSMGAMLQIGSEASKDYFLGHINSRHARYHREGLWHLNDANFALMTMNCLYIPLGKLLNRGFNTGHGHIRPPATIGSASTLTCIIIQSNQNDMFGGQGIPALDWDLGLYVAKSYVRNCALWISATTGLDDVFIKEHFTRPLDVYLKEQGIYGRILNEEGAGKVLAALHELVDEPLVGNHGQAMVDWALNKTEHDTHQAMESMVHNLNTLACRAGAQVPFSSVNTGLDTSEEGRMITRNLFRAQEEGLGNGETPIFPITIMKLKKGITDPGSPNYDLFKQSCKVSAKRLLPNWVNLDAEFNSPFFVHGLPETEVSTMGMVADGEVVVKVTETEQVQRILLSELGRWLLDKQLAHYAHAAGSRGMLVVNTLTVDKDQMENCTEFPRKVQIWDGYKHRATGDGWTDLRCYLYDYDPELKWVEIETDRGFKRILTTDHPLVVKNGSARNADTWKRIFAGHLVVGDIIMADDTYAHPGQLLPEHIVTKVTLLQEPHRGYDVNTESDRFTVDGIVSHNCRTRVMANVHDAKNAVSVGRGNLFMLNISLPYIALELKEEHPQLSGEELVEKYLLKVQFYMNEAFDHLSDRFELLAQRHVYNFPFLMGQGLYLGADDLQPNDEIREVIKNGTLTVGFIGLSEALVALTGKHHGESSASQELGLKIVGLMHDMCKAKAEATHLNFSLMGSPAEGATGRLLRCAKKRFGKIEGVTDKAWFTNSHHIDVRFRISAMEKIRLEAPYHKLEPAGHIGYLEFDGEAAKNLPAFEKLVLTMAEAGMGYFSINHKLDRDPVCGYQGIIGDVCPRCGRREGEGVPVEQLRKLLAYSPDPQYAIKASNDAEQAGSVTHDYHYKEDGDEGHG